MALIRKTHVRELLEVLDGLLVDGPPRTLELGPIQGERLRTLRKDLWEQLASGGQHELDVLDYLHSWLLQPATTRNKSANDTMARLERAVLSPGELTKLKHDRRHPLSCGVCARALGTENYPAVLRGREVVCYLCATPEIVSCPCRAVEEVITQGSTVEEITAAMLRAREHCPTCSGRGTQQATPPTPEVAEPVVMTQAAPEPVMPLDEPMWRAALETAGIIRPIPTTATTGRFAVGTQVRWRNGADLQLDPPPPQPNPTPQPVLEEDVEPGMDVTFDRAVMRAERAAERTMQFGELTGATHQFHFIDEPAPVTWDIETPVEDDE